MRDLVLKAEWIAGHVVIIEEEWKRLARRLKSYGLDLSIEMRKRRQEPPR